MNKKIINNFIKKAAITVIVLSILICATVILFDPFYHYHKPLPFLKAVLSEKEYQVPGSLDHFDYDSIIVGSSVCENYNNRWFDDNFDCKSIKAIRSYGAIADLSYYANRAFDSHKLKYVFFNIDPQSLASDTHLTFKETNVPLFLYNDNPFDDVEYLFNKDVLFKRIPYMIAQSFSDYDEGESFNWYSSKTFSEEAVLSHYSKMDSCEPMKEQKYYEENCLQNIALLKDMVNAHPETEFYFFMSPYSVLWWDYLYCCGDTESYLYNEELFFNSMSECNNVHLYNFQNAKDIVFDLNNYMDTLHFTNNINKYICDCLHDGTYELKNSDEISSSVKDVYDYASNVDNYLSENAKKALYVD